MQAPKYVILINEVPVPVMRDETKAKIEDGKLTLRDILEEAKYFLKNGESLIVIKGVLEAIMAFMEMGAKLDEYWKDLSNKIRLLEAGLSGRDVSVRFDSKKFSFREVVDKNILELTKPKQNQTPYGFVYSIELFVAEEGHVGKWEGSS